MENKDELKEALRDLGADVDREEKVRKNKQDSLGIGTVLSSVPKLIRELTVDNTPVNWIWTGYLAKGSVTLLSALWKSGKSTLVSQLLKAIQEEESLAGQPTIKSKVLILSEESENLWARRNEELDLTLDAWVVCRPLKRKQTRIEWEKQLEETSNFCLDNDISTIIIDTLSGFWSARNENDAAEMQEVLMPLNNFLEKDMAVLLIHHFRKSGGTEGVASRGSGVLGSFADILVEFSRLDKESPTNTQRVLRAFSRFDETHPEVVIELIDGEYITRGTRAEVGKKTRMAFVVKILADYPKGLTSAGILEVWDNELHGRKPVKRTINRYISDLLYEDKIQEVGTEKAGKKTVKKYGIHSVSRRQDREKTSVPIKRVNTTNKANNKPSSLRQDTYLSIGKSSLKQPVFTNSFSKLSLSQLNKKKDFIENKLEGNEDDPRYPAQLVFYQKIVDEIQRRKNEKTNN